MKKKDPRSVLWCGLVLLITLAGCDLVSRDFDRAAEFADPTKGSLYLRLDGGALPTKTIAPSLSMDVSRYELVFTGPDTIAPQTIIGDTGVFSRSGLAVGSYTVAISAYNSTDNLIGALNGVENSTEGFPITAGNNFYEFTVIPIGGTGTLDLTLRWPTDAINDPDLVVSLTPTPLGFAFGVVTEGSDQVATYRNETMDTGYYFLNMQLFEQGIDDPVWGIAEAVRIIAGQESIASWNLTTLSGDLELTAKANMENPVDITFVPEEIADFSRANPLSVTADPEPADPGDGSYTYSWYLDGAVVAGANTATVSFAGNSLAVGNHNLSVLITVDSTLSSKTIGFKVLE